LEKDGLNMQAFPSILAQNLLQILKKYMSPRIALQSNGMLMN